ncbi:kinase-like domain-containing protein [Biscogniauxia sp. FL1348]|nr:kinase-like domain-containing protein [Biscogniauxia sp. FL1348]
MKRNLPETGSMPALSLDGGLSPVATPSLTSRSVSERGEPPQKLRRQGSRIMSALRSLTNSASGNSIRESTPWPAPSPSLSDRSSDRRRVFRKMTLPFLRSPFGASVTVVHRIKSKSRPSLRSMERATNEPLPACAPGAVSSFMSNSNSNSNGNSNTTSSGKSSGPMNGTNTTAKTSFDSKLSSKDNNSGDRRPASIIRRREPETGSTPDSNLTTIQETALDITSPTILTVERAAAAKIFLETHFNELLSRPSPRSIRRRYLEGELYHNEDLTPGEKELRRRMFYNRETAHLRETRVLKAKSIAAIHGRRNPLVDNYEVLKILGKGSFGVVRLVRDKTRQDDVQGGNRVYAMKVIRKSTMLRTSQEGHLRAERDFLVASEGSRWIVPLIASFQDAANLYLVMDYMSGGDFLGLLIRENILNEPVAKFYVAEMILCIEEAHALRCIHRDIKPDNFLVSASGHLKISDFGLAFDGHWSHDTSYYHTQRYSLLQRLGLSVEGDAVDRAEGLQGTMKWAQSVTQAMHRHERQAVCVNASPSTLDEPLLNWRNRCGNRSAARSCVGTSQYMAPEVIQGGRQQTKRNIVNHRQTFAFPSRPVVSRRCMDLIANLVREKENRLSSKRYRYRDMNPESSSSPGKSRHRHGYRDWTGRSVYPHDAEDIKAHKWFRDIPWDQLHAISPPFVPQLRNLEDTHYFDEEESISDWSNSQSFTDSDSEPIDDLTSTNPLTATAVMTPAAAGSTANPFIEPPSPPPPSTTTAVALATAMATGANNLPSAAGRRSPQKALALQAQLATFPRQCRGAMAQFVAAPYDTARLKRVDREIEAMVAAITTPTPTITSATAMAGHHHHHHHIQDEQRRDHYQYYNDNAAELENRMKAFVRTYGRRERKRPRDRLLRDRNTRAAVLEVRKQTAFLGYTYRRPNWWVGGGGSGGSGGGSGGYDGWCDGGGGGGGNSNSDSSSSASYFYHHDNHAYRLYHDQSSMSGGVGGVDVMWGFGDGAGAGAGERTACYEEDEDGDTEDGEGDGEGEGNLWGLEMAVVAHRALRQGRAESMDW